MKFIPTALEGAYVIEVEPLTDTRGFFARLWCQNEFKEQGISMQVVQSNVSHNASVGTIRGMHFQWSPSQEAKVVRCEQGRVYDVIIDLRPDSATFTQHVAVELDSRKYNAVYVPPGFAHGFQTLEANSDVIYLMSDYFQPELADGFRYDDPKFEIVWPLPVGCIIDRDRNYPDFDPEGYTKRYRQASKTRDNDN